jgi:hypothetical protein
MPMTRSNDIEDGPVVMDHWAYEEMDRQELLQTAQRNGVKLSDDGVFEDVFGVERLRQYSGSLEDACRAIEDYAKRQIEARLDRAVVPEPVHAEAKAIAWTNITTPSGVQINVTAREGATRDMIVRAVLELGEAVRELEAFGYKHTGRR